MALGDSLRAQGLGDSPLLCSECHALEDLTRETEDGGEVSIYVDEAQLRGSVHGELACVACHQQIRETHPDDGIRPGIVDCGRCHSRQADPAGGGVHGALRAAGTEAAPGCADCHGSHDTRSPADPDSPLHWSRQARFCGECHPVAAGDFQESVHGVALARNVREAPGCGDCHLEHAIPARAGLSPSQRAVEVCSRCHESERLTARFGLRTDRVTTFFESYHGLAVRLGSTRAANCASCHGYHRVLPSSDPRSAIHPDSLQATCGHCHPGAGARFVESKVHVSAAGAEDFGGRLNRWVRRFYLALIAGVVGAMLVHNVLAWRRALLRNLRRPRRWLRLDRSQRWQHGVLVLSFVALAISGFALEYPGSWLAWVLGSEETVRRLIHRASAVVLLGAAGYHLWYVGWTPAGRRLFRDLLPRRRDGSDLVKNVRHFLNADRLRPVFGRFSYPQKVEYWTVFWGVGVMGLTGFLLWFAVELTEWLPRWVIQVARTIHYYEAVLAVLAIAVWHLYHVMFDPRVYPMNWAWWDGRVDADRYRQEHGQDPALAPRAQPRAGRVRKPGRTS